MARRKAPRPPVGRAYRVQIAATISAHLSPDARRKAFLAFAENRVAELQAAGKASLDDVRAVNGIANAPDSAVTVPGNINYQFNPLAEVAAYALAYAKTRSPFKSGRFAASFMVAIDSKPMKAADFNAAKVTNANEIIIWNSQPYSRKIDVQIAEGHRPIHFSVAPGLFTDMAKAVKSSRWGNTIDAVRKYTLTFPGAYILKTGRDKGTPVQSPCLIITRR